MAVRANPINRNDIIYGRDMLMEEIIGDGKVIHPVWAIYPASTIVPLVQKIFNYNRERSTDRHIGISLPAEPKNQAEMRALYADGLDGRSGLCGDDLGSGNCRLVGVVDKAARGSARR